MKKKNNIKTLLVCLLIVGLTLTIANTMTKQDNFMISYVESPGSYTTVTVYPQDVSDTTTPENTVAVANLVNENTTFLDSTSSEVFSGINTFENDDFTFKYVNSWIQNEEQNETSEVDFLISGRNAFFSVVKEKISDDFTIEDYTKTTKKTLEKKENNKVIEITDKEFNTLKGSRIIYEITNQETGLTSIVNEFCIIKDKEIFVFTYYADSTKYENYIEEYEDLLNTLSFK